jgi:non-ribosomal peptide synthetase component F
MWVAWRHGASLVPAPCALVRSGMDLAPWLVDRGITVVSTAPTLASSWPPRVLDAARLLIFAGQACPPELVEGLAVGGREVWNTYGPPRRLWWLGQPVSRRGSGADRPAHGRLGLAVVE